MSRLLPVKPFPLLILLVGLLHGLIYVFLIPPWEHYDEPGHFEYAWLIANRLTLPKADDFDIPMRLALGKSLLASGFFIRRNIPLPNLTDPSQPLWIGYSQLGDPPAYYLLLAIPLWIVKATSIDTQLHITRLTSNLFLLLTLWFAYKLVCELTPESSRLRLLIPAFIALLPGFVEFMTATNDHVGAICLLSLWLWISIKIIKNGINLRLFLILIFIGVLAYYTQKIDWIAILLTPIVIILGCFHNPYKWYAWIVITAGIITCILFLFNWDDAALWLRSTYQDQGSKISTSRILPFNNALRVKVYPDSYWGRVDPVLDPGFFQLIPQTIADKLSGKDVTVGGWVWSDKNIIVYGPGINALQGYTDNWLGFPKLNASTVPIFIATTIRIPEADSHLQLWLRATSPNDSSTNLYFSGIVLVPGSWPLDSAPQFLTINGDRGIWGGKPFYNLARNALFQTAWPNPKPKVTNIFIDQAGFTPSNISSIFALLLDPAGSFWYIKTTSEVIFRTFWAKFAWGQVQLLPSPPLLNKPYRILLAISLFGLAGAIIAFIHHLKRIPLIEEIFLGLSTMSVLAIAYFYGVYAMGGGLRFRTYFPVARYIYPAIIPIISILVCGWSELANLIRRITGVSRKVSFWLFIIFIGGLDIYSFVSIIHYFYVQ